MKDLILDFKKLKLDQSDEDSNLISDFNKLMFFDEQDNYMELNDNSLITKYEYSNLTYDEVFDILKNSYIRYESYLNNIIFTNESEPIKYYIKKYTNLYNDYKTDEYKLFKLMIKIDNSILDTIHKSKHSKFWLN